MPLFNGRRDRRGEGEEGRFDYGKVGRRKKKKRVGGGKGMRHVGPARVGGKREGNRRRMPLLPLASTLALIGHKIKTNERGGWIGPPGRLRGFEFSPQQPRLTVAVHRGEDGRLLLGVLQAVQESPYHMKNGSSEIYNSTFYKIK